MNKVFVRINGTEYTLKGEEKEEYLHKIASHVDKKLKSIMDINPRLDVTSASVLTAVNSIDEMLKAKMSLEELELKKHEFNVTELSIKEEVKNLKKQLENMQLFNDELKEKLKNLSKEEEVEEKNQEITKLKEALHKQLEENSNLKNSNKELKFQNQSAKYKILDLQKKLIDSQIDVAKTKKEIFGDVKNNAHKK